LEPPSTLAETADRASSAAGARKLYRHSRSPDIDCGEIAYRRFTVRHPHPHGFDGDHDGVGCES
jgi:micrococcal nuclease